LNIDTTSGAGFSATGGGTVNVTGASNTVDATTGTALNVSNTTIGASGLTFQNLTSNGSGSNNGIILDTTGTNAGLTVTGTARPQVAEPFPTKRAPTARQLPASAYT